jgi:undecaprenyl-diphosphatase
VRFLVLIISTFYMLNAFPIDEKVKKDDSAFWKAHYDVPRYSFIGALGIALSEGTETRLGKTSWQSVEAGVTSQIITGLLKDTTRRTRPGDTDDPDSWGKSGGQSFPSGHVSGMTAIVTPYILEYKDTSAWTHILWLLPIYQMVGRVKANAHWQSDVIVGALVGYGSGYLAHNHDTPIFFHYTKDKKFIGLRYKF